MRIKIEMNGKTYRVYTLDVGSGPKIAMDVQVATGPRAIITSHFWRTVKPGGPIWNRVMAKAEDEIGTPCRSADKIRSDES